MQRMKKNGTNNFIYTRGRNGDSNCCNLESSRVRKLEKSIAAFESEDQCLVVEVLKVYENLGKDETTSYVLCVHKKLQGSYGLDVSADCNKVLRVLAITIDEHIIILWDRRWKSLWRFHFNRINIMTPTVIAGC
jgi:hypothetical protein